jgi:hypothetical protein
MSWEYRLKLRKSVCILTSVEIWLSCFQTQVRWDQVMWLCSGKNRILHFVWRGSSPCRLSLECLSFSQASSTQSCKASSPRVSRNYITKQPSTHTAISTLLVIMLQRYMFQPAYWAIIRRVITVLKNNDTQCIQMIKMNNILKLKHVKSYWNIVLCTINAIQCN